MYDKWVDTNSSHIIFNLEKNECINEYIIIFCYFLSWGCTDEWNFITIFLMLYEYMHDYISLVFFLKKRNM